MKQENTLQLFAPVSGKTVPIDAVPDLVFAQKTIGDGIAIAPSSYTLCAPADGTVTNIHASKHALTMKTVQGIEVLMHIGLDTVLLRGEGFSVRVRAGQKIQKGDKLIDFDRNIIEKKGKSLLTVIVVTDMKSVASLETRPNRDVKVKKDPIITLTLKKENSVENIQNGNVSQTARSFGIEIKNPAGLHARPIAVLVAAAKLFSSTITMTDGAKTANVKSLVAIMKLDVKKGDKVILQAEGSDAPQALKKLIPLLESGLGEDLTKDVPLAQIVPNNTLKSNEKEGFYYGIPASAGAAVGVVVQLKDVAIEVEEFGTTPQAEKTKLADAVAEAKEQLEDLRERVGKESGSDKADIFAAHAELLDDPELMQRANDLIDKGRSAAFAWQQAVNKQAGSISEIKNALLAARADDLRDVGKRVLRVLTGEIAEKLVLPDNAVILANDLTPSDTAALDRSKVVGFGTVTGGSSSHAAILARSMLLPAVCGLPASVLSVLNGTTVLLDGTKGLVRTDPTDDEKRNAAAVEQTERRSRAVLLETKDKPAITTDGVRITVAGNISSIEGAREVVAFGGEGVGLLRSEFLFIDRQTAPSEDEQTAVYRAIADTLGPDRSLIVRTLDVGGDKKLPYLPRDSESNPFLGVRGLRLSLSHPELFRSQIRSILRAADKTTVRIMFPMVTVVDELQQAETIIRKEEELLGVTKPIETGIMIEVPAAALTADVLAPHVDFFSIGTNDLTQYIMAADRGNANLSSLSDGLHPAVLKAVKMTVDAAAKHGKWVGVCGALAGDKTAVSALIGLGITELSVAPPVIPEIKAIVRSLSMRRCQDLAATITAQSSAQNVRHEIAAFLNLPEKE